MITDSEAQRLANFHQPASSALDAQGRHLIAWGFRMLLEHGEGTLAARLSTHFALTREEIDAVQGVRCRSFEPIIVLDEKGNATRGERETTFDLPSAEDHELHRWEDEGGAPIRTHHWVKFKVGERW